MVLKSGEFKPVLIEDIAEHEAEGWEGREYAN
jgi:hypothetical protein